MVKPGYLEASNKLNEMCEPYGYGEVVEGTPRSVSVEDINRVTGYNVNEGKYDSNTKTYKVYGYGTEYEYLNIETYKGIGHFKDGEWITANADIQSNYYSYYPTTLSSESSDPERGIKTTSPEYIMLFKDSEGNDAKYFLNNQFVRCHPGYINYGLRAVAELEVQREYLVSAGGNEQASSGVRAVVPLKSNITLKEIEAR